MDHKQPFSVVPPEPTEKMLEAAEMAMSSIPPWPKEEVKRIYAAMIAAWELETSEIDDEAPCLQ